MDSHLVSHEDKYLLNQLTNYPINNDGKFSNKGKVLDWPGCTIIYNIKESSKLSLELQKIQNKFKKLSFSNKYSYLPKSSFHMTLFDCCNIKTHNSKFWPKNISQSDDFLEIAFKLSEKLNNYSFPKNINVKLQKFFGGFSTLLLPNTLKDNQILRSCRDDLSKILGIKYDNHITYTFHITLAYLLKPLTPKEVKNLQIIDKQNSQKFKKEVPFIELNNPEICVFDNMYKFTNVKKLTRIT